LLVVLSHQQPAEPKEEESP